MSTATSAKYSGMEGRRSTRVEHPVTLIVLGKNGLGQPFQEKTASVSVNLHGCRYPSRHEYPVGSWVGLQVVHPDRQARSPLIRAQVRSVHTPDSPRELFQIGVELEIPSNVWGVSTPPEDWQKLMGGELSTTHLATGGNLPREPGADAPANGATNGPQAVPSPNSGTESTRVAAAKTERFVITSDQLILSVRPKLQQAAEQAMQSAITTQLDEAVREAIGKIEEFQRASGTQTESTESSAQNFEPMVRSSEEAILNRMETRLTEVRSQWMEQQEEQHRWMQELSQRIEKLASEPRQETVEKNGDAALVGQQIQPAVFENKVQARMDEILKRTTQEFESAATRVSDRHLIRLMEDKQMVAREATAQMEARAAEARAVLHSAAGDAVDEFRRQLQSQVDMMIAEASQKASSALASIEAESRSACETRRRSLETDVSRVAEQSAEQFRTGIKAFLYSCLVAAVSAVDEHSQTTLEGLVKGGLKDGPEDAKDNGHNGKLPHQFTIPGDGSNENNNEN
ncbi:MAG TPA: hypothetical protein VK685_08180 [Candidatus Acidoferrum sp.]|nr:hypothetical protein [Candidatus Acidoferrum sp.]